MKNVHPFNTVGALGMPTGTGSTEAVRPGPPLQKVHGVVEDQASRSLTVQQVSADTEVRGRVLRGHMKKRCSRIRRHR